MYWISGVVGGIGLFLAFWLHLWRRQDADRLRNWLLARGMTRWLPVAMENKWYVDELYHAFIRAPLWLLGHLFYAIDRYIIDGLLVDGTAHLPRLLARWFQPLSNGMLQSYAVTMAGGAVLIALLMLLLMQFFTGGGVVS
jgi:NADH:ubiquinone oxidoreductase subunit 5 (subunit L)/multisubunit Na+/H+ antiporter MnhA subunit